MSNSYTKLRNGSWGVRVDGAARPGQVVTVKTKAGEVKTETVDRVIWKGDSVSICSIVSKSTRHERGAHHERGVGMVCDECGERATPGTRCWETGTSH